MKTITVNGSPVGVSSGQVRLSRAQYAARAHALRFAGKPDKDGRIAFDKDDRAVFEVLAPLQFKSGEAFGFTGEVSKAGQLRDRAAEERSKLDAVEAAVTAAVAAVRAECDERIAGLRAELEPKLRAELLAELKLKG